jgi:hypothetical protein
LLHSREAAFQETLAVKSVLARQEKILPFGGPAKSG